MRTRDGMCGVLGRDAHRGWLLRGVVADGGEPGGGWGARSWSGGWVAPRRRSVIHVLGGGGKPCGYLETGDAGEANVRTGSS